MRKAEDPIVSTPDLSFHAPGPPHIWYMFGPAALFVTSPGPSLFTRNYRATARSLPE